MALSISCDFDETAATANVARLLLDRFSTARVKEVERAHRRGETPFRAYQEQAFDAVDATMAEMAEYVKQNASLRPGFRELAERLQRIRARPQGGFGRFGLLHSGPT